MGFAVYHIQKGSGSGGGLGNHIDRKKEKKNEEEETFINADPEKTKNNGSFKINEYTQMPLAEAIKERLKDGYKGTASIRKDAVKYLNHILTGSHEDMKKMFLDNEQAKKWIRQSFKFISDKFGKENIVRFTLHLDEKTPHIHCVTVPLTDDGRLCAKEIVGNNKKLQAYQDTFAEYMEEFGLERGVRGSKAKHTDLKEYYARINEAKELKMPDYIIPDIKIDDPPLFGKSNWKEQQQAQIKNLIEELVKKQKDIGEELISLSGFKTAEEKIREKEYRRLLNDIKSLKNEIKAISQEKLKQKIDDRQIIEKLNKEKLGYDNSTESLRGNVTRLNNNIEVLKNLLVEVATGDKTKKDVEDFLVEKNLYRRGMRM